MEALRKTIRMVNLTNHRGSWGRRRDVDCSQVRLLAGTRCLMLAMGEERGKGDLPAIYIMRVKWIGVYSLFFLEQ